MDKNPLSFCFAEKFCKKELSGNINFIQSPRFQISQSVRDRRISLAMANREWRRAVDVCDRDTFNTDPQDEESSEEFKEVYNKKGRQRIKQSTWSLIRPLPDPPLQSGRYVLCNRGVTCRGPQCTFAHSQEEMESWNNQLHDQMRHQPATEMSSYHRELHQSMIPDWPTPRQSSPVPRPVRSMIILLIRSAYSVYIGQSQNSIHNQDGTKFRT